MPPLPVIADTFRCTFDWSNGAGQIAANVMHIRTHSSGSAPSDIFELLQDTVVTNMWASCGAGTVIYQVDIIPLDGTTGTESFTTGSSGQWLGGGVGDVLPAVAVVVKLSTGLRGRSNRGRVFVPFTSEAGVTAGELNGGTQAIQQTAWESFVSGLESDGTTPSSLVVASYKMSFATNVHSVLVETPLGTQRRRQGRLRSA